MSRRRRHGEPDATPGVADPRSPTEPAPAREAVPKRALTSDPARSTGRLVGARIDGRYQIVGLAGRGGLGRVFLVEHVALGKKFALKLMNADLTHDDERRELFYREAKVASALMHPHVVSVVDFGEDPVAGAFMVMEFLEGESLAERLRRHPRGLPLKVFFDVLKQLAEALHYIHSEGVIHGDIKADNVICWKLSSTSRRRWQIKVLDFGLAFLSSSDDLPATVGGTPEYIAPERLEGAPPHASSDIYSLGVLAYELLTGDLPFRGDTKRVLQQQMYTPPPPIAVRRGEPVDERIEALLQRALAKKPADRHDSMEAFLYELRTLTDMLGMSERQGRRTMNPSGGERDRRLRAAAAGFDHAPFGMAGINVDGAIVVANAPFAKFLTGHPDSELAEDALLASSLLELYPSFLRDLRRVHVKGIKTRRSLIVPRPDGTQRPLTVLMAPGGAGFGEVHVTVLAGHLDPTL
jgi:eukaryotic-like serine/threonine-protein kinase